jgi:hypothetical protein
MILDVIVILVVVNFIVTVFGFVFVLSFIDDVINELERKNKDK